MLHKRPHQAVSDDLGEPEANKDQCDAIQKPRKKAARAQDHKWVRNGYGKVLFSSFLPLNRKCSPGKIRPGFRKLSTIFNAYFFCLNWCTSIGWWWYGRIEWIGWYLCSVPEDEKLRIYQEKQKEMESLKRAIQQREQALSLETKKREIESLRRNILAQEKKLQQGKVRTSAEALFFMDCTNASCDCKGDKVGRFLPTASQLTNLVGLGVGGWVHLSNN